MQDTNDAYELTFDPVEDDVVAGNEMPHTAANILSRWSGKRVARQLLAASINRVEDAISGSKVLGGNRLPDVDQILVWQENEPRRANNATNLGKTMKVRALDQNTAL